MAAHLCAPCKEFGKLMCPEDRPSPIFTAFSLVINAIMGIIGVSGLGDCIDASKTWVILGVLSCIVNGAFSCYLYYRFCTKIRAEQNGVTAAVYQLLMYDWGVCCYLLFGVWLIAWMAMASGRDGASRCSALSTMVALMIVYVIVGILLVALSLMTECCRTPTWRSRNTTTPHSASVQGVAPPPSRMGNAPPPAVNPAYVPNGAEPPPPGNTAAQVGQVVTNVGNKIGTAFSGFASRVRSAAAAATAPQPATQSAADVRV